MNYRLTVVVCVLVLGLAPTVTSQTRMSEDQVIEALRSGNLERKQAGVSAIREMPATARSSRLLAALASELKRHTAEVRAPRPTRGAGAAETEDNYLPELLEAVVQFNDPAVVDSLVPHVGTGNMVIRKLATFGDRVVPQMVNLALQPASEGTAESIMGATYVLYRLVEREPEQPLSNQSRRAIIGVARERLQGNQPDYLVGSALELAVITGDQGLLNRVKALATSEAAVRSLGVSEPVYIGAIQKRATMALSSVKVPARGR